MPNLDAPTPAHDPNPTNALISRETIIDGLHNVCRLLEVGSHLRFLETCVGAAFGYDSLDRCTVDDLLELHMELENAARRCGLLQPDKMKQNPQRITPEVRRGLGAIAGRRETAARKRTAALRNGQLSMFGEQ